MGFVIDNLRPQDRLSVVSISSGGRRVTRLLWMSGTGKATAKTGSNIAEGLRTAAKVLVDRRRRNTMSSVILLSDGRPGHQHRTTPRWLRGTAPNYEAVLHVHWQAPEIGRRRLTRVDSATTTTRPPCMHVIAEATAGRRSSRTRSRSASAVCSPSWCRTRASPSLAGIPEFASARSSPGVTDSPADEHGRSASVRVGELYADEERRFLLFLSVPAVKVTDGETALTKVSCSYRDTDGGAHVDVTTEDTVVARPEPEHVVDAERSTEVERERVRVEATEDNAAARAAAERGAHQEAVEILESRQ